MSCSPLDGLLLGMVEWRGILHFFFFVRFRFWKVATARLSFIYIELNVSN